MVVFLGTSALEYKRGGYLEYAVMQVKVNGDAPVSVRVHEGIDAQWD